MAQDCCATGSNTMILACSGGSNVGQLSNQKDAIRTACAGQASPGAVVISNAKEGCCG